MDKVKFLINMFLVFFIYLFNKYKFNGRDIWFIGGYLGDIYNDNLKFFYEYMLKEYNDVEIYWVVNKDSKVFDKILGKKLIRGSVENYLYYYNLKVIVFLYVLLVDIVLYNFVVFVFNYFYKKMIKVFLNYGIISFKKRKFMNKKFKNIIDNLYKSYNIVIVSFEFERNVMVNDWGMLDDLVYIIGNVRYDNLLINEVV